MDLENLNILKGLMVMGGGGRRNFKNCEGPLNTLTNNHKAYARTCVQPDQNR